MTNALTFWATAMTVVGVPIAYLNRRRLRAWMARMRDPCEPKKHGGDFWLWQHEPAREPKRDWLACPQRHLHAKTLTPMHLAAGYQLHHCRCGLRYAKPPTPEEN